jgi:hydrogenase expression/formation protein HypC
VEFLGNDLARVDISNNQVDVSIRLTPEVKPGQYVLVHAGFAMEIIDERYARETMQLLQEMQSLEEPGGNR